MAASPVSVPLAAAPAPSVAPAPPPAEAVATIPDPPAPAAALERLVVETAATPSPDDGMLSYPPKSAATAPAEEAAPALVTKASVAPAESAPAAAPGGDIGARRARSVQKALNQIGYGPVPEDGIVGEGTIAAIRRFELDNGLPITGAAGDTLIERLVAIGAMEAA
jgi:peptidoglycan hydrolase-like protein with peptidoglycan-binding domain